MPKLIMLVGLPGTGKSHLRARYSPIDWKILSSDDIIEEMGRADNTSYSEGFNRFVTLATKKLNEKVEELSKTDHDVIWDQTNLTRKVRIQKLLKFPNHEKHAIVVLPKPVNEIMEDMYKYRSEKIIPRSIMENMEKQFEHPTTLEGFQTVTFYTTNEIFS